jgi:type III secretory pathway component EscS
MKGEYSQSVSVLDSIQLFFGYVLFHALPPILVAALAGALVGLFLAHARMEIDRQRRDRELNNPTR